MEYVFYLLFFCIVSNHIFEGRPVQAIIGRNVSFSYTLNNATRDAFKIFHNKSLLLWVWPNTKTIVVPGKEEKVRVSEYMYAGETCIVNITLLNITQDDVGTYTVERQRNSKDFNYSVVLRAVEETMIPRIDVVRYITWNSSLVLKCFSSNSSEGKFLWKLNTTLIQNNNRYSHNNDSLSIRNVTADEKYNAYTCIEYESALESDPYIIKMSGPSVITFAPNKPEIIEHDSVNVSCNSDCTPICSWQWTTAGPLLGPVEASSSDTFQIKNITRSDAGNYTCTVLNVLSGTVKASHFSLDVVYGPDEVVFNTTNDTIEMDEFDSMTISCFADCFPPCHISWSKADIEMPGAVLRLSNEKDDSNFTCYARNAKNANTTIFSTMRMKVKSGITYDMTTSKSIEEDRDPPSFPSIHLLMYIGLGLGAMFAIGFFTCVLQKILKCLRKNKVPNSNPLQDIRENKSPEGNPAESYWTIVSNEKGDMSTALETSTNQINEPSPVCSMTKMNQLKSSQLHRVKVDLEYDGYIHPIHRHPSI